MSTDYPHVVIINQRNIRRREESQARAGLGALWIRMEKERLAVGRYTKNQLKKIQMAVGIRDEKGHLKAGPSHELNERGRRWVEVGGLATNINAMRLAAGRI